MKKIIKCTKCPTFNDLTTINQLINFRAVLAFLHEDHSEAFNKFIELTSTDAPLEETFKTYKELYGQDYIKLNEAEVATEILLCIGTIPKMRKGVKINDVEPESSESPLKALSGKEHDALLKKSIDIFPKYCRGSVQQTQFFDAIFTRKEAQMLFLMEWEKRKDPRYGSMYLTLDMELPLDVLEKDFTTLIKKVKKEREKELLKEDARLKTFPFDKWDQYIKVYMLKKKAINARLLVSKWPDKRLGRQEIARYIFGDNNYDTLQKTDRYVARAKILIERAKNYKGEFQYCQHRYSCYFGYHILQSHMTP